MTPHIRRHDIDIARHVVLLCAFRRLPSTHTNVTRTSPMMVSPCGVMWINQGPVEGSKQVATGACLPSLLAIYQKSECGRVHQ